ncbi:MAG: acetylglutamate kinase [Acidobacteria bacterium]|nr:acetylglutamate kinase [Acidobacteriota bacterium]
MKVVVKLGGATLEDAVLLKRCTGELTALSRSGVHLLVVHGGGAALTRTLGAIGCTSQFVDGLRVTDAQTRDVAVMVLAGLLNKRVVAAFARHGQFAVGLCGGDGGAFRAQKLRLRREQETELGFVGEICDADLRWIEALWGQEAVPVLASVALGWDGEYYNVNADHMAAVAAGACGADRLVFLTDVPGLLDANRKVIAQIEARKLSELLNSGVATGGMRPKLNACRAALGWGVREVTLLPAVEVGCLAQVVNGGAPVGTRVLA